jgi:hypothetical protein
MRSSTLMMTVVFFMAVLVATDAWPGDTGISRYSEMVTIQGSKGTSSCADLGINFGSGETFRSEETVRVPGRDLSIKPGDARNLGVQVVGWSGSDYEITVCRAASHAALLGGIVLEQGSGTVSLRGPDGDQWTAYLLVKAPAQARLGIETRNGPASVRQVDGQVVVRAANGPVRIEDVRGNVDVEAKNGPIHFQGDSGEVRLISANGPLTIDIGTSFWTGGRMEARSTNGPVSLRLPPGFSSGVVVETRGRSPFRCDAGICANAVETRGQSLRRLRLGGGPEDVHVSTSNGPMTIRTSS